VTVEVFFYKRHFWSSVAEPEPYHFGGNGAFQTAVTFFRSAILCRQYVVETLGVKAWYVEENESRPLPDSFSGQFHTADTYVVRWKYKVSQPALAGALMKGCAAKRKSSDNDAKLLCFRAVGDLLLVSLPWGKLMWSFSNVPVPVPVLQLSKQQYEV
jgi:hypothetical protein